LVTKSDKRVGGAAPGRGGIRSRKRGLWAFEDSPARGSEGRHAHNANRAGGRRAGTCEP
jgi:hypothetical protein